VLLAVAPAAPTAASLSNIHYFKSDICISVNFHVKEIYDKFKILIFSVFLFSSVTKYARRIDNLTAISQPIV
jgi:hypothetical protein